MFEKFPSIDQYRQTIKAISDHHQYIGKDADGNTIFDRNKPLPTLNFLQTVKIHGTNGGVILLKDGTIRTQSRNRVLDPVNDNNGFDKWIGERSDYWRTVANTLFEKVPYADKFIVYGEFAGESIQKNVAVTQTPKSFYVFSIIGFGNDSKVEIVTADNFKIFERPELNIYSIYQFPHQSISIDLNCADEYVPILQDIALTIEKECPVGLYHGVSGVGEGAVFIVRYGNDMYRFKVKGEKHSASKVKLLSNVDSVMIASVREFVEQVVTENRLQQGIDYMNEMGIATDIKHTGDFIKWVVNDVHKEESDLIKAKGFEKKLVNQAISKQAKRFYFEYCGV